MSMTQRYAGMLRRQAADWDKREMPIQAECCRQAARHMEELQASKDSEIQTPRAAPQWYADGLHFDTASPDAWDTVSGELTAAQIQALDDDDQAWDRNAERITREVMGADVDRPINPHATSVDDL